jgi:hypothetical protein
MIKTQGVEQAKISSPKCHGGSKKNPKPETEKRRHKR